MSRLIVVQIVHFEHTCVTLLRSQFMVRNWQSVFILITPVAIVLSASVIRVFIIRLSGKHHQAIHHLFSGESQDFQGCIDFAHGKSVAQKYEPKQNPDKSWWEYLITPSFYRYCTMNIRPNQTKSENALRTVLRTQMNTQEEIDSDY